MMEFEVIRKGNLSSLVKENLKLYFARNGVKGGDRIPTEAELARGLGVSRTAVREGLKSLESLGIIEVRPGIGRFLKKFNFDSILENLTYSIEMDVRDFRDILEVRIALETAFLREYIAKYTQKQIRELEDILDAMRRLESDAAAEAAMIQVHTLFHLALYRDHGNQLLLNLIKIFSTVQRSLTVLNRYQTHDIKEFINLHQSIVDAIKSKDADRAVCALLKHFEEALGWSARTLKDEEKDAGAR